jgi:hypothetical protein
MYSCDEVNTTVKANLSGLPEVETVSNNELIIIDSTFIPTLGNGVKHFYPALQFTNNFNLFQSLLQNFKYEALPFDLDAIKVDKTEEEWKNEVALDLKYYGYLLDKSAFQAVANVTNPRENLSDFYQIHPIVKFNEKEFFQTLIYAVRYLDGNGQQDKFYLTTFSNEGVLLSSVEVGALEASAETYIKTAQIKSEDYIKVHHADYDEKLKDWVKTGESEYYLDNTGQVYIDFENLEMQYDAGSVNGENSVSTAKMTEFSNYFQSFQKELKNNAPQRLLSYITFPHFRVSYEEHFQDFRSKEEFLLQYPIIFNEAFRKKIIRQNTDDLIVNNDEIGLSDGSMWFKRIGRDNDGKLVVGIRVN